MEHLQLSGFFLHAPLVSVVVGCADKASKQRMRLEWLRLELWVELASDEVGMVRKFDHLDVSTVGR